MSTRPSARKRRGPFDRHWAYPNPAPRIRQLLGRSRAGTALQRLIADGDPRAIRAWMQRNEGPFELFNLLQLGLGGRPPADDPFLLFDELPVATRRPADPGAAADTLYARRTGDGFAYRVWSAGAGAWVNNFTVTSPLTRPDVRRLFRTPARPGGGTRAVNGFEFHDPGRGAWDPDAYPGRFGGWDGCVEGGSDEPAPCPVCGYDLNNPDGDRCAHFLSDLDLRQDFGDWAGGRAVDDLRDAGGQLEEATAWMSKARLARFLRAALPPRLRKAAAGCLDDTWVSELQDYLESQLPLSPTGLGGCFMESVGMGGSGMWTVWWDSMAATRARELDRQFAADRRAIRAAVKAAGALAKKPPR